MSNLGPGGIFTSRRALKQHRRVSICKLQMFQILNVPQDYNQKNYVPVSEERQCLIIEESLLEILLILFKAQLVQHASCPRVVCVFTRWLGEFLPNLYPMQPNGELLYNITI